MDRIDIIRKVRQQLSGMTPKKMEEKKNGLEGVCWPGYEAIGLKPDGSPNCVPVKMKKVKEGFPIPSPSSSESEQEYISRCNSELYDEYPDDAQRNAICYKSWREK